MRLMISSSGIKSLCCWCVLLSFLSLVVVVWAEECPKPSPDLKSVGGGAEARLRVINKAGVPIVLYWMDMEGNENVPYKIDLGDNHGLDSFIGHSFRIYSDMDVPQLLMEYTMDQEKRRLIVYACDGVEPLKFEDSHYSAHHEEMQSYVHDQTAPCLPADNSSQWSCILWISKEEYDNRVRDGTVYGFNSTHESGRRQIGETFDETYMQHVPQIPRVTNGKGFLKMSFTDNLKNTLMPWYNDVKKGGPKDSVEVHPTVPGGYTNSHAVKMSKVNLDNHPEIQIAVWKEMKRVLEWWTGQTLRHTSTFGMRIYHRDSMLINHVDRADTHIASAVIQVGQNVDQGWPLEILDPATGNCAEVYLQPGEMVLYEGARFPHGRPMRFNGTDFANIFSHFRPVDWFGPNKSPAYDGKLDDQGYLSTMDKIQGGEDKLNSQDSSRQHSEL